MHLCAEYFFKVRVPPPPSLDELLKFYEDNWLSGGYESAEEELKYRAYGREILARFWQVHHAEFRMPLAVERLFNIDIDGMKMRGYIDRVDKLESGGLSIIDYKTNRDIFTTDYLQQDLQLTLYQVAAGQLWQLPVHRLTLYHLRSNTPCSCGPRGEEQLRQARRLVTEVAENIARGRFPAVESQNCPCDFPEYCPYYRQQYADEAVPRQAALPGMAITAAVEQYVSLQEQIKELQTRLDEIKQLIVDYCQAEGLSRVFGTENAITCKIVERTGFSEEAVRALLEPEGLWQRVLCLDHSRLRELLADDAVAKDVRSKLEALKEVISTHPQLWVRKIVPEG